MKLAQALPRVEDPEAGKCPCHVYLCAPFFSLLWLNSSDNVTIFPISLEAHQGRGCVLSHFLHLSQCIDVIPSHWVKTIYALSIY